MSKIRLRPSSIRSFMETPNLWWARHIEGTDDFIGNTKTYLGTVVHKFAESYYTMEEFNPHAILENAPDDVDKTFILSNYEGMCKELERKYLSRQPKPELMEHFICKDLDDTFECGGSMDAYFNGILVDYKTSSNQVKKIDDYINQMHIYAYLLSTIGKEVHSYRVVNIVARTKTIEPRVNILECKSDIKKGEYLINLMHKKAKIGYDNPMYKDYIFNENTYSFLDNKTEIVTDFREL